MPAQTRPRSATIGRLVMAALIGLCALGAFAVFRWWVRLAPLNSDDMVLFDSSQDAAVGDHWLFSDRPREAGHHELFCLSCGDGAGIGHQALRTGLLPVAVPLLRAFGPQTAYYLVPLAFQLIGAVAVWAWIERFAGRRAAWIGFGLLALMPYEVDHASRYFVDLPAAACLLWALWLLAAEGTRWGAHGAGAGLFLGWAYLLRENSPLLVAPSLALLVLRRERRPVIAVALATLAGVFASEQLVFVAKGLGVGFRSRMVADALATYAPFLPVYSLSEFAYRELVTFYAGFGGWPLGVFACMQLLAALGLLAWTVWRSDSDALRALAACGLTTWALFTYAPLRIENLQVRALAPIASRYLQPLFYAGFCLGVIAVARLWRRHGAGSGRRAPGFALAGIAVLAGVWWLTIDAEPDRVERGDLPLEAALDEVARVARAHGAAPGSAAAPAVWGAPHEIRGALLLDTASLAWHGADVGPLAQQLEQAPEALVLRFRERELVTQRYLGPRQRRLRREADRALDAALWSSHHGIGLGAGLALFVPGVSDCRLRDPLAAAGERAQDVRLGKRTKLRVDVLGGSAPALDDCPRCTSELRIELALEAASGQARVRAQGADAAFKGLPQTLTAGTNYFAWSTPEDARRVWVELDLRPEPGGGRAAIGPATLRRCPLPESASAVAASR